MLPKKNRASTKDIDLLFKRGKFIVSPTLTFRFVPLNEDAPPRISVVAPKNIAKLAVKRNLLRRRGYAALEKHIGELPPGIIGVFTFKKYEESIPILENEIKSFLGKLN